jgi:hypothetical protein
MGGLKSPSAPPGALGVEGQFSIVNSAKVIAPRGTF